MLRLKHPSVAPPPPPPHHLALFHPLLLMHFGNNMRSWFRLKNRPLQRLRNPSECAAGLPRRAYCALRCTRCASACVRNCVFDTCCRKRWLVLRRVAAYYSGCIAETRRGGHYFVQAAAAARVAGGLDILRSAANGDGASVVCHVIADAVGVNKRDLEARER